jgi:hypothetical protein
VDSEVVRSGARARNGMRQNMCVWMENWLRGIYQQRHQFG